MKWNRKLQAAFERAKREADNLINNIPAVTNLLDEALRKISSLSGGKIKKAVEDLQTLVRMVKAYVSGEYKDIPWATLVSVLASIIYFVNPFDLVPDFIPLVGYIDDLAVLSFVLMTFGSDIDRFRNWEDRGPSESATK